MTPIEERRHGLRIEVAWHQVLTAMTDEGRANACRRYVTLVNERNAARTAEQTEEDEGER